MVCDQKTTGKLTNEIMAYYEQTLFPSDISNQMANQKLFSVEKYYTTDILVQSIPKSPLCHVSVTGWCKKSGYESKSDPRNERCARLTADVAVFTVEQLNKVADGQFKSAYAMSAAATECRACHSQGKKFEQGGWARGKMDCSLCHDVAPDHFDL